MAECWKNGSAVRAINKAEAFSSENEGMSFGDSMVQWMSRHRNWVMSVIMALGMSYGVAAHSAEPKQKPRPQQAQPDCSKTGQKSKKKCTSRAGKPEKAKGDDRQTAKESEQQNKKSSKAKNPDHQPKKPNREEKGDMTEEEIDRCINEWRCYIA